METIPHDGTGASGRSARGLAHRFVRSSRRRLALALLGAAAGALFFNTLNAGATQTHYQFDIRVRGVIGDGHNPIEFEDKRFSDVATALAETATAAAPPEGQEQATLALGPDGFADVNVKQATITVSDPAQGKYTMTFRGHTSDFFGHSAELLGTAKWASDSDTHPELALFFRFQDVDLLTFEPDAVQVDLKFTKAWVALSRNTGPAGDYTEVEPDDFPEVDDYFDDGISANDDAFKVLTTYLPIPDLPLPDPNLVREAVTFRGVVDPNGVVGDVASHLGLSRDARVDGAISMASIYGETCPSKQSGFTCTKPSDGRPKAAVGLMLSAEFKPAGSSSLPQQIAIDAGWTFTVKAEVVQGVTPAATNITVKFEGSAAVEMGVGKQFNMGGRVTFKRNTTFSDIWEIELAAVAENVTFSNKISFKSISLATGFTRVAEGSTSSSTARITGTAVLDLQPLLGTPGDVALQVQFVGGTSGFAFTLAGSAELDDGARLNGLLASTRIASAPNVPFDLKQFGLAISIITGTVDTGSVPPGSSTTTTTITGSKRTTRVAITVTAQTSIDLGGGKHLDSDVLAILSLGGAKPEFLFAAKPSGTTTQSLMLSDLLGKTAKGVDFELPDFYLSVASKTWIERPDYLNEAVKAFVETQTGPHKDLLFFREGVSLKADIELTGSIAQALGSIGIATDGKLRLAAALPLFGSPTWGGEIATPAIASTNPGPFRSGQFRIVFGSFWSDPRGNDSTVLQVGVVADAEVDVRRERVPDCDTAVSRDQTPSCFDRLRFSVGGAMTSSPTTGLTIEFRGNLLATDGWDEPFGVEGLTVHTVGLMVGVTVPPTGPPGVLVGFSAGVDINTKTFNLSFLLKVTPTPPWILPMGFTFAVESFEIQDLAELHNLVASDDADIDVDGLNLPNIRLENVYFAYGAVDDPKLCIRAGFFLAAELHHGGTVGGSVPACNQNGNLPPKDVPVDNAHCEASTSCIASVLIDVQLGTTVTTAVNSRVIIQGFFAGAQLGPLELDPTIVDIELSAKSVHFRMSGGGGLSIAGFGLVHGEFLIDISPTHYELRAEMRLLENLKGGLVIVGVHGLADFEGFEDPEFKLDIWFRSPALQWLGQKIEQGFQDLGRAIEAFGQAFVDGAEATWDDAVHHVERLFGLDEYDPFEGLTTADEIMHKMVELTAQCEIVSTNEGLVQFFKLHGITLDCSPQKRWQSALFGFDMLNVGPQEVPPLAGGGCRTGIEAVGIFTTEYFERDGKCWADPSMTSPGYCDSPSRQGHPLCNPNLTPGQIVQQIAIQDFIAAAQARRGMALALQFLQPGTAQVQSGARATASSALGAAATSSSGLDPAAVLTNLYGKVTEGTATATCATMNYDTTTSVLSELSMKLDVDANGTTLSIPVTDTPEKVSAEALYQKGVEALVNGSTGGTECATPEVFLPQPLSVEFRATSEAAGPTVTAIDEGGTVWARGTAPGATSVAVDWADGSAAEAVTVDAEGNWAASHSYAESGSYSIGLAAGDASLSRRLRVVNLAPAATVDIPATTKEGDPYTINVTVTDPGVHDTHSVTVYWGDLTSDTYEVGGEGVLSATHTYEDEGSVGQAAVARRLTVEVQDDERARASSEGTVEVANVAPHLVLAGPAEVDEAQVAEWTLTVTDPGVIDLVDVTIDWGNGTEELIVLPSEDRSPTRTATLSHAWADDDPTGTPQDGYQIKISAADGDTGTAATTANVTVRNVAPTVTVTAAGDAPTQVATVDEAAPLEWTVAVDDPGLLDTHKVMVDWGDGSKETFDLGAPADGSQVRSRVISHTWADDDPTATPEDPYTVSASAVDDDTGTGSGNAPLMVRNVAPIITDLTTSVSRMNENEAGVTLQLAFADAALRDSHTVTIDWGDGWAAGSTADTDVSAQDVSTTVVDVPAPAGPDTAEQTRALTAHNRYGDDSTYAITVTVVDDDTGQVLDSRTLVVDNVTPEHAMDKLSATDTAGGPTWLLQTGESQTFNDSATDPGSEDLRFDWNFGDGTAASAWWLRSTGRFGERSDANGDPRPSPQVGPVAPVSTVEHAWSNACLYGVSATVFDDDGATAGADHGAVAVQRAPDGTGPRNFAQWRTAIESGEISSAELDCYLDIAGHLSSVLLGRSELDDATSGGDPTPWSSRVGSVDGTARGANSVPAILDAPPARGGSKLEQEQAKFDRALMAVWLSYAHGSFSWDQVVDGGATFHDALAELETIRRTSSDAKAVTTAWQRLNAITRS